MKQIMLLCLAAMVCMTACKKTSNAPGNHPDVFVFGNYNMLSMCWGFCGTFYMIKNSTVYKDSLGIFSYAYFKHQPMPDSIYTICSALTSMPAYLLSHKNTVLGGNGNVYATALHIVSITGTDTARWDINIDTTGMPAEIKPYVAQMQATLTRIYY